MGLTILSPVISISIEKNIAPGPLPPEARKRDFGKGTMGVGSSTSISIKKKCSCRSYTPPSAGNGTPAKGQWGWLKHPDLYQEKM